MLEPLIVLTVLNCIFMFSSTVTTCALWWQYQSQSCCSKRNATQQKSKTYTFRPAKKSGKSKFDSTDVNVVNKNDSHEHKTKRCKKKRSKKSVKYLAEDQEKSGENISLPLEAKKLEEKRKMSEASQTINDTKSTVVMEFSTVQKVVQIVDNDSDINSARIPLKDIVVKKDTANKKRDYNIEQNFGTNIATAEN
ncbi:uncharacterized protein [Linepithema humile]|uniref:uncharacterized protein n=1 Tax=Linepithema humile TaxID=83485 RepID=UPI00351F02EF